MSFSNIVFILIFTTTCMACSLDIPIKTSKDVECTPPTAIVVTKSDSVNQYSIKLSLGGITSGVESVIWKVTYKGTELFNSKSIPIRVNPSFSLTNKGSYNITCTVKNFCGTTTELSTIYNYDEANLVCVNATSITAKASTPETPLDLNLKLNGNTSDIVSVLWLIKENTKEVYKKTISDSPFSILSTSTLSLSGSVGDYLITAKITDKCGQTYDLTYTYSYSIPNSLRVSMVSVEGGTFYMGSNEFALDERPIHSVTLKNFFIGKYEVTVSEWKEVMGTTSPSYFASCEKCPVESVTWQDTQTFIEKLNKLTGKTYRLPTEAEWEYAARGGKKSKGYLYSGSNTVDDVAWYSANGKGKTQLVGQKDANELEIFDMSGNVWEWCNDIYAPYTSEHQNNPTGPSSGAGHVLRGGSWNDSPNYSRVTVRFNDVDRGAIRNDSGFRLVLVP